jgi:dihydrodipicolinate synthase/N-acetylneuraminate lyase
MTDWNLFLLRRLLIERPDIVVYNGYDELICLGMLYGAQGSIGTWQNLFPEMYVKIYNLMKAGETNAAADIQKTFMDFLNIGWKYGIVEVFEALMREKGYADRCFRKPYSELKPGIFESIQPQLRVKMDAIVAKVAEVG